MKYVRLITWEIKSDGRKLIKDICEFEGGVEGGQIFRKSTGTCTRLFSKLLREALLEGDHVSFESGEY